MKRKLYTLGLMAISFLMNSCTNDQDDIMEKQNSDLKSTREYDYKMESNVTEMDSITTLNLQSKVADGEPSNPVPPRSN